MLSKILKNLSITAFVILFAGNIHADGHSKTIKIGILHSLSGTMAISETTLKDTMLMLIDEQNKKGGILGKKLEPVVVDPASNWPLFAEKARELLTVSKVDVMFGCWTSVSRKSVLDAGSQVYLDFAQLISNSFPDLQARQHEYLTYQYQ